MDKSLSPLYSFHSESFERLQMNQNREENAREEKKHP